MKILGLSIIYEDENSIKIEIGTGENWSNFVEYCVKNNYAEILILIPGTVGGAVTQNIGAYGLELKDIFCYLKAVNIKT